jgi:hypothetical protein
LTNINCKTGPTPEPISPTSDILVSLSRRAGALSMHGSIGFATLKVVALINKFSMVGLAAAVCFMGFVASSCDFTLALALSATTSGTTTTMLLTMQELAQRA